MVVTLPCLETRQNFHAVLRSCRVPQTEIFGNSFSQGGARTENSKPANLTLEREGGLPKPEIGYSGLVDTEEREATAQKKNKKKGFRPSILSQSAGEMCL